MKYLLSCLYILFSSLGIFLMKIGGDSLKITTKGDFSFSIGYVTAVGFFSYIIIFILWQKVLTMFDLSYIFPITAGVIQIITLIIFSIVFITITTIALKKDKMPIKYALIWYFSAVALLIVAIFPKLVEIVANFLGFEASSSLIIGIVMTLLLIITLILTIIVSGQKRKITLLIQEISLIKKGN